MFKSEYAYLLLYKPTEIAVVSRSNLSRIKRVTERGLFDSILILLKGGGLYYKRRILMAIERAKELKGKNGMIAGTAEYLNDLNSDLVIKQLTKKANAFNYYRSIKSINNDVSKPAGEILRDLKEYAPLLRYVPSGRRDTLKRFLNGLYELSGYTGAKESKLKQAISLADLSDSRTKKNSRASDRDIDKEVDIIYHGSVRTKGSLNNSSSGKGRRKPDDKFYMDIVNKYQYKYEFKGVLKGKNGVDIFSDKYIEHYEKEIFKTAVAYKHNGGKFTYVQFIKELLNGLYGRIIYDVDSFILQEHTRF